MDMHARPHRVTESRQRERENEDLSVLEHLRPFWLKDPSHRAACGRSVRTPQVKRCDLVGALLAGTSLLRGLADDPRFILKASRMAETLGPDEFCKGHAASVALVAICMLTGTDDFEGRAGRHVGDEVIPHVAPRTVDACMGCSSRLAMALRAKALEHLRCFLVVFGSL